MASHSAGSASDLMVITIDDPPGHHLHQKKVF